MTIRSRPHMLPKRYAQLGSKQGTLYQVMAEIPETPRQRVLRERSEQRYAPPAKFSFESWIEGLRST